MRYLFLLYSIFFLSLFTFGQSEFRKQQQSNKRVKVAYANKWNSARQLFKDNGLHIEQSRILLRAFKEELKMELWAAPATSGDFKLLKTYAICAASGTVGPKRKMGDGQVPEGFYVIDRFNPSSNFHLSLGVSYPNKSDKILGDKKNLGGDIFIHGNCVTIGCMPLTDEWIEELYVIAIEAKAAGQKQIPVYVFPFKMDDKNFIRHKSNASNEKHLAFWNQIKSGYDLFEKHHTQLKFNIDKKGNYHFD